MGLLELTNIVTFLSAKDFHAGTVDSAALSANLHSAIIFSTSTVSWRKSTWDQETYEKAFTALQ